MINLTSYFTLLLCMCSLVLADVRSGILVAVSGEHTASGRAVIAQNIDSNEENVKLQFFQGKVYNFIGLVISNDTSGVCAGQNTAGFAIVATPADFGRKDAKEADKIIKRALGSCGRTKDFVELLGNETANIAVNFACLDPFGGTAVIELVDGNLTILDVTDPVQVRKGYLVRSNFAFSSPGENPFGSFRYNRAVELVYNRIKSGKIDIKFLTQSLLRDLATEKMNPFPFHFGKDEPVKIRMETNSSINRHNTVASVIFQSFEPSDPEMLAWCALGQPIATAYFPFNPKCQSLHSDVTGGDNCRMNLFAREAETILYPDKSRQELLDIDALIGGKNPMLRTLFGIEDEIGQELSEFFAAGNIKLEEQCHELQSIIAKILIQIR